MANCIYTLERTTVTGRIHVEHCYRWLPTARKALEALIAAGKTGYQIVEYQEVKGRYVRAEDAKNA